MPATPQFELLGLDIQQLTAILREHDQPEYRARQLFEALYRRRCCSLQDITEFPLALRDKLAQTYAVGRPLLEKKFVSVDGTIRYLMRFLDGELVETVWMPQGDEEDLEVDTDEHTASVAPPHKPEPGAKDTPSPARTHGRATICVSSQVGCALSCSFCMTALLGVQRSLGAGEIVGQVLSVLADRGAHLDRERVNLVFMGMGEPFLNYVNFMHAVRLLVHGVGIPESRMTVSTAGIVPQIRDFGREAVRPKLAISLNASNDELRDRLMPINRKWKLGELISAARAFPLRDRERLTFEYVLLENVNDAPANAKEIAVLLRGIRCKVNLIALNPGSEIQFATPSGQQVLEFQSILRKAGIDTFIRKPRGRDIFAACGQLKKTSA